ncbi:Hsp70 family protein [Acanthopleuribacter pedis]|uniref:Hsp70 family protein n=1 Tax=Acanthopleuribacter pedis TaxID=442870 RepID=A0A8J7QC03_9BACT|nr:Hsp70 family protein [Acanthopleuribacter pedis]MBO1318206.1 Hsp70 family protein [Acanthopleuribacter pedis]
MAPHRPDLPPGPIVGIDLGTTNSEIAVYREGRVDLLGDPIILPSVVGCDESGRFMVGEAAKNQFALFPERTVRSVKRQMGGTQKIHLGDSAFRPEEISALILKELKRRAEAALGVPVRRAVITVPAYFSDAQRQATFAAAELADLEVMRMIHEPTAAALAYEVGKEGRRHLLVYDLGGGTFDVSVVTIEQDVLEVMASTGDRRLGGDDFDQCLVRHFFEELKKSYSLDADALQGRLAAALLKTAEATKVHLSDFPFAVVEEAYIGEDAAGTAMHLRCEVTREEFEQMITPLVDRTMEAVQKALLEAELTVLDIEEVVLVGGSTRTPFIQKSLERLFGLVPRGGIHPELCVATGAAVQAAVIDGVEVDSVLLDVTPYTFGTNAIDAASGGEKPYNPHFFAPIIRKNTPIPVTKSEVFCTVNENQKEVEIKIYQGESDDVRDNLLIGDFTVTGLSPAPAGNLVTVQLSLTADGILEVTAQEKVSGLQKSLVIRRSIQAGDGQSISAAKERIERLFAEGEKGSATVDAAEDGSEESLSEDTATEVMDLIARAESLLPKLTGNDARDVATCLAAVKDAANEGDEAKLDEQSSRLDDLLFYLEM